MIYPKSYAYISFNTVSGWTPINCSVQPPSIYQESACTSGGISGGDIASKEDTIANTEKPCTAGAKATNINGSKRSSKRETTDQWYGSKRQKRQKRATAKNIIKDEEESTELSPRRDYANNMRHAFVELVDQLHTPGNQTSCSQHENYVSNLQSLHTRKVYKKIMPIEGHASDSSDLLSQEFEGMEPACLGNKENHGWSESTLVTDDPFLSINTSSYYSEAFGHLPELEESDGYGDLDENDLVALETQLHLDGQGTVMDDKIDYDEILSKFNSSTLERKGSHNIVGHSPEILHYQHTPSLILSFSGTSSSTSSQLKNDDGKQAENQLIITPKGRQQPFKSPIERKPIARRSFPQPTRDRSPVIGISSGTVLRTCFRIGEAINAGSQAIRENKDVVIELYSRVKSSHREIGAIKQYFQLLDLYHDRPPYLDATYHLWPNSELWDRDSQIFLDQNEWKMCRCLGRMKRDEQQKLIFVALHIWEATWQNVDFVEGITLGESS
jgi:hypothetical protein